MKFVLVLIIILSDSLGATPAVTTAEFNSEQACRSAAADLEATLSRMQQNTLSTVRCYPKGS
jgi:hypothetical protein